VGTGGWSFAKDLSSCHAAQKAESARLYRHRVDVGLIQCSNGHNPHGTQTGHQQFVPESQQRVVDKLYGLSKMVH
jgi:hypothetical protein